MKFTKIKAGVYKSENGYTIKKHVCWNIFTGKPMSESTWDIFNPNNEKVDFALTLREGKEIVERM